MLLCDYLKNTYKCILEIDSDGSNGIIWWTKAGRVLDRVNLIVNYKTIKKVKARNVAEYLYEMNVLVNVNILVDVEAFETCTELVDFFQEGRHDFLIFTKPIGKEYTITEKEYLLNPIKQHPDDAWIHYVADSLGTHIYIDAHTGDIILGECLNIPN